MLEKLEEVDIQTEEPKTPERAEALTSADNSSEKKEEATELVSAATDNNILEPKKVDAVYVLGNPGFQTVRHILVRQLKTFTEAQRFSQQNYRGNLISTHNSEFHCKLENLVKEINQGWVWTGAHTNSWLRKHKYCLAKKFKWIDRSSWHFSYWTTGQPLFGWGCCVALCTNRESGNMEGGSDSKEDLS
uniref:Bone marrow proteoglycan-like n=1 Tax=Phascolarctos cinereus TaxID=38626 RepID=A0A6P5J9Q5_PHACI|nr:bone marrow proteoglycan-like [Phascolarctos cinereus]